VEIDQANTEILIIVLLISIDVYIAFGDKMGVEVKLWT